MVLVGGDYADALRLLRQEREAVEIRLQLTERENTRLRQVRTLLLYYCVPSLSKRVVTPLTQMKLIRVVTQTAYQQLLHCRRLQ